MEKAAVSLSSRPSVKAPLTGYTGILDGDSDSWVVDRSSLQVFGHVVASDVLGNVEVVPIRDTFDDVKQSLGVSEVSLPTADDI